MNMNLTSGQWRPVGWSPTIYEGAPWRFGATLANTAPGDILGGALFVNGVAYDIEASDNRVSFEVPAEAVARIPHRAACSLYIDRADTGRFLWLNGSVTKGDTGHG